MDKYSLVGPLALALAELQHQKWNQAWQGKIRQRWQICFGFTFIDISISDRSFVRPTLIISH